MEEVKEAHDKLLGEFNEYQAAVTKTMKYNARIIKETAKLDELETPEASSTTSPCTTQTDTSFASILVLVN